MAGNMKIGAMKFIANPVGIIALAETLNTNPVMMAVALEIAGLIAENTPVAPDDEHLGTTSEDAPTDMRQTVKVGIVEGRLCVFTDDFRYVFIEFGYVHEGSGEIVGKPVWRQAAQKVAMAHGFTYIPMPHSSGG